MSELQEQAREMYVRGIVGYKRVAKRLGVSDSTVRRWLDPEYAEHQRVLSREAKRRRVGVCSDCGGETRYGGRRAPVSRICFRCSEKRARASRVWTREAVIAAIQRWAERHGRPPTASDWIRAGDDHPAMSNVYRTTSRTARNNPFASWADAIEAAGFERPETGGRYRERPWLWKFDHAEALRLLGEGLSGAAVARRLGVSSNTISRLKVNGGTLAQRR